VNILAFDIETIPDVEGGRRLYDLDGLNDEDIARVMFNKRREKTGNEFLPVHLHRIVAISAVLRSTASDEFRVWTLGDENSGEKDILLAFFDEVESRDPTLVTWNGGGFDLPVINHRGLINSVPAIRYRGLGGNEGRFEQNNYIGPFHDRHIALMDALADSQSRAFSPLNDMAVLLGFPVRWEHVGRWPGINTVSERLAQSGTIVRPMH
jgi:predicted PolB exonuclease-like 3'-5' exonuclease